MEIQNYQKIKVLGEGTYGKCYLVNDKVNNQLCVLKQIQIFGMSEEQINDTLRESHILQALDHPYIVKFIGSFKTKEGYLNILMNYADGGDLSMKIKEVKAKQSFFREEQILTWFTQICLAIKHVHDRKIIHRDIKSQNIFLTKQGEVKLGDFGIAKPLQLTLQKIKSVVGTPYYMSPQICQNKQYSFKTDIWSLGVILLEMCLLKPPFDANSLPVLALKISKGQYHPPPKYFSRQLRKLISDMLQVDPLKRPSIAQILRNPIVVPKIQKNLSKFIKDKQFSHTTLHSINIMDIKPSRGLMIELNSQDSYKNNFVSPKNSSLNMQMMSKQNQKYNQMPLKKNDNYVKELAKIPNDRRTKKGELKKREISEPNLTPKNHTKIENDRKVIVKNNSVFNFQKKSSQKDIKEKDAAFKKKSKNIMHCQAEVSKIQNLKHQIVGLQMSARDKSAVNPLNAQDIEYPLSLSDSEKQEEIVKEEKIEEKIKIERVPKIQKQESVLQTLQNILLQYVNQEQLKLYYLECQKNSGICSMGPCAGLVTLSFALQKESV